jgi:heptaprenyl diphosphate synthase
MPLPDNPSLPLNGYGVSGTFERTRRLAFLALLTAFAVALHTVEAGLPNPTPWLRLGLANIITLLTLVIYGFRDGMTVCVLRIFIGSIITTGLFGPVIGAYMHSLTQMVVAYFFFIRHQEIFMILPIFLITAVITGFINGLGTHILYHHLMRLNHSLS